MHEFDKNFRRASAISFGALLACSLALGCVAAYLELEKSIAMLFAAVFAMIWIGLEARFIRKKPADAGEWQRRIDREYRLEIDDTLLSLYRHDVLAGRFRWDGVNEIQLQRCAGFPHLLWRVIADHGEFLLPNGGRYAREFEMAFIYRLPGYYEQRVVKAQPLDGFRSASSLWRRNDRYPKRELDEDEDIWF